MSEEVVGVKSLIWSQIRKKTLFHGWVTAFTKITLVKVRRSAEIVELTVTHFTSANVSFCRCFVDECCCFSWSTFSCRDERMTTQQIFYINLTFHFLSWKVLLIFSFLNLLFWSQIKCGCIFFTCLEKSGLLLIRRTISLPLLRLEGNQTLLLCFFSNIFSAPVRSVDDEDLLSFKHLWFAAQFPHWFCFETTFYNNKRHK